MHRAPTRTITTDEALSNGSIGVAPQRWHISCPLIPGVHLRAAPDVRVGLGVVVLSTALIYIFFNTAVPYASTVTAAELDGTDPVGPWARWVVAAVGPISAACGLLGALAEALLLMVLFRDPGVVADKSLHDEEDGGGAYVAFCKTCHAYIRDFDHHSELGACIGHRTRAPLLAFLVVATMAAAIGLLLTGPEVALAYHRSGGRLSACGGPLSFTINLSCLALTTGGALWSTAAARRSRTAQPEADAPSTV